MHAPPTVGRKINREGVVLLGWGRAILLQLSHPLVAAGVADFSQFDRSTRGFLRRVRRTVGGMLAITFGPPEVAREVIERINGIHDRVSGALARQVGPFAAGTKYSARDPELLLWVHATLVDSMILTYEQLVAPLTAREKDEFCAEAACTAVLLGVPSPMIPLRFADLEDYMRDMYSNGQIVVSDEARRLAGALLSPPLGPASAPLFRLTRLVTVGLLPASVRDDYGFRWDRRRDRAFRTIVAVIKRTRWLLPSRLREWPIARVA
jgi:uncharacterized protein (DUF2236 family)